MDLSAYMAAKRRARGEVGIAAAQAAPSESAPGESDVARRDRIVAANLAAIRTPNLGSDPRNGGGLFEIKRLGADDAEFMFYGWNKEIKRRVPQMIEVKRGTNGNDSNRDGAQDDRDHSRLRGRRFRMGVAAAEPGDHAVRPHERQR